MRLQSEICEESTKKRAWIASVFAVYDLGGFTCQESALGTGWGRVLRARPRVDFPMGGVVLPGASVGVRRDTRARPWAAAGCAC